MKRLLLALSASLLLVGSMSIPTEAATTPKATTVSGSITFADDLTTVHATFKAAELPDPNGYLTVTSGSQPPITLVPYVVIDDYPELGFSLVMLGGDIPGGPVPEWVYLIIGTWDDGSSSATWEHYVDGVLVDYVYGPVTGKYSVKAAPAPKLTTEQLSLVLAGTTPSMLSPAVTGTLTGRPKTFNGSALGLTATGVSLGVPFATTYLISLPSGDTMSATGMATASVDTLACPLTASYRVVDLATVAGGTGGYGNATGSIALDGCLTAPAAGSGDPYGFTASLTGTVTH